MEIEFIQFVGTNVGEIELWMGNNLTQEYSSSGRHCIFIPTLEGIFKVDKYDYIIKGVNGEFYPCKPDIFEKTYDVMEL